MNCTHITAGMREDNSTHITACTEEGNSTHTHELGEREDNSPVDHLLSARLGQEEPGAGRALLSSVLKGGHDGAVHHGAQVRSRVHHVEVLAPAF